jgi:hypothetical protein
MMIADPQLFAKKHFASVSSHIWIWVKLHYVIESLIQVETRSTSANISKQVLSQENEPKREMGLIDERGGTKEMKRKSDASGLLFARPAGWYLMWYEANDISLLASRLMIETSLSRDIAPFLRTSCLQMLTNQLRVQSR